MEGKNRVWDGGLAVYVQRLLLRASAEELEAWRVAAGLEGLSLSGWARRALGEQEALERSLRSQEVEDGEA